MNDIDEIGQILNCFLNEDDDIRNPAVDHFFKLLKEDPDSTINALFFFIVQNSSCNERVQALIQAYRFLYSISVSDETDVLSTETYQNIMSTSIQLLEQANLLNRLEIQYIFFIISTFIKNIIIPGNWPEIYGVMWNLIDTELCSYAITFFKDYFSKITMDNIGQVPEEFIARIAELIKIDSQDANTKLSSISLVFKLLNNYADYAQVLEHIPQAMHDLPDSKIDEAIDSFDGFYQYHWKNIAEYKDGFISVFLNIAQDSDRDESCRISSLEILEKMLNRDPYVRRYLNENISDFLQVLSECFEINDLDDSVYNSASLLLQEYVKDTEANDFVAAQIGEGLQSLSIPVVSVFLRYILKVQFIDQIEELAQQQDPVVSRNAFETIEMLLRFKYQKLIKHKPEAIQELIDILFGLFDLGNHDSLIALAQLSESLSENNKEKLQSIAPKLMQLYEVELNYNSIRCAAAVATAFPDEVSEIALNLASQSMEMIINGADAESTYALMIAISTFAKCMPSDNFVDFVNELMNLVKQYPETSTYQGLRLIALHIGEPFSEFLPLFVPYLIEVATQSIDAEVRPESASVQTSDYLTVFMPGSYKMEFRNEQMSEIANALESLADYAEATKAGFAPFFEDAYNTAESSKGNIYELQIRIAAVKLFLALTKCNPESIPSIFLILLQRMIKSDESEQGEQQDILSVIFNVQNEVEVEGQQEIMAALESIINDENCPQEVKIQYLNAIPAILQNTISCIREDVEDDEFEGAEDMYLNVLWPIATTLKFLYSQIPDETGKTFIQISENLLPFQDETVLILNQFAMAIWSDFLIEGPEELVSQCNEMLQQVLEMVNSSDKDIRRMALYSIGRIFEKRDVPDSELDKLLNLLYLSVSSEEAQNDEDLYQGNDNALSSYALLLVKRIPMGNAIEDITHFVEMFPAEDDLDEAKIAYAVLFNLLWEAGNNPEIASVYEPICEKLAQGLEIEVLSSTMKSVIEEKLSGGNVPPQVAQFLSQFQ